MSQRRDAQVHFRCTAEQRAALDAMAEAGGFASLSDFILTRCLAPGRAAKTRQPFRALAANTYNQLQDLGAALNGQALAVNAGRDFQPQHIADTVAAILRAAREDEILAVLLAEGKQDHPAFLPAEYLPLQPAHYAALARVGNNLNQIAEGLDFGAFRSAAEALRRVAAVWAAMVRVEADRITFHRIGGKGAA